MRDIPGVVAFGRCAHGLERFTITNAFADAEVYLLGAHVTHFRPKGSEPVLWLSPRSAFEVGKAIRGGVPTCWPWFGPHPSSPELPAHGIARTREWQPLDVAQLSDGRTRVRLVLRDDASTRAVWPHAFSLVLSATVGESLDLELTTTNTGRAPFSYMDALHTYIAVSDVRHVRVEGLDGAPFMHSTRKHRGVQTGPILFDGEVNHIHTPHEGPVVVQDPGSRRAIVADKDGSLATVIWNPGESGGSAMKDVGPHWSEFACVEAATCADSQILLLPGTSHTTTQNVRMAPAPTT